MVQRAALRLLGPGPLAIAGGLATAMLLGWGSATPSAASLQGKIGAKQSAANALRRGIAGDNARAQTAGAALARTERQLAAIQSALDTRTAQLAQVKSELLAARTHLTELENRLRDAIIALAANLRQSYEGDRPDWMTVVFESHGFADMLERLQFLERIRNQDVSVVRDVRTARTEVMQQATRLGGLEVRDQRLAAAVQARRNQVAALQTTLARERIAALRQRDRKLGRLRVLHHELAKLEAKQARIARAAVPVAVNGQVQAPGGAPAVVARVIAAGNAIAGLPYRYGGGHGSFHDSAYDCSGSVSYALAAGGLVSSPLDSTAFESWGAPGPGRWITVYANASHAFMMVAGWRFDTGALGSGTRWEHGARDTSGFVARHPPGL